MAGLAAARSLTQAGLHVVVIEARDRVGGRILTERIGDQVVELGAEFVHGRPAELLELIDEAGLTLCERDGAQVCFEDGKLGDCGDELDDAFDPLQKLKGFTGPDMSFAEFLDGERLSTEPLAPDQRGRVIGYVEGFNAADHRVISAAALGEQQRAEDANGSGHNFHVSGGYDQIPSYLADQVSERGGRIVTGMAVEEIRWQRGGVECIAGARAFYARKAIVTLPLGVLERGSVTFSPRPDAVLKAAGRLRMGQVRRFTLMFRNRFWEDLPPQPVMNELSFLFAFSEMPPVWWTTRPECGTTLTGWVGGPRSAALASKDAEELGRHACATLSKIFSVDETKLKALLQGCYTHDWEHDPYACGAYSYVATGGLDASNEMTVPVEETLFFAGEHTDITGHWGTVHAALRSGLRAAGQVIEAQRPSR